MSTDAAPRLSVVVPIYNVERYLDECLDSVAAAEVSDLEAILVDDGSTDGSAAIARRRCESDPRFRLVSQENAGLGAARNVGARAASGVHLAFLDSDDVVPADAWRSMLDVLDETGSDFATANVHRFDSSRRWQASMYKGFATELVRRTHVTRDHDLLRDHLAPNKVFRTSFWRDNGIAFPVGVLYEDVPTIVPAHFAATAVDVVPTVATMWRVRDRGDHSITQEKRHDPEQVRCRVDAILSNARHIREHGDEALVVAYDTLALQRDMGMFVDLFPEVDDDYRKELSEAAARVLEQARPAAVAALTAESRLALHLLASGAGSELDELLRAKRAKTLRSTPVAVSGDRVVLDAPARRSGAVAVPDAVVDVTDALPLVRRVVDVRIVDDAIHVDGWAYVDRLHGSAPSGPIRVRAESDGAVVDAVVTPRPDARADVAARPPVRDAASAGFTAVFPLRAFRRYWRWSRRTWRLTVSASCGPVTRTAPLGPALPGAAQRPRQERLGGSWWLRTWTVRGELHCGASSEPAVLADARRDGDDIVLDLAHARLGRRAAVEVRGADTVRFPVSRSDGRVSCRLRGRDLPPLAEGADGWAVLLSESGDDARRLVTLPAFGSATLPTDDGVLHLRRTVTGTARLYLVPDAALAVSAALTSDATLELAVDGDVRELVLSSRERDERHRVPITDDRVGRVALAALPLFGATAPIRAGWWDVLAVTDRGDVPVAPDAIRADVPLSTTRDGRTYTLTDVGNHRLVVDVEGDLTPAESGPANLHRLRTEHYPASRGTIRPVVLYESYFGKQYSDSPARMFEALRDRRPDLEHVWVVRDRGFSVPDGAVAVPHRSARHFEALATSRYVVTNCHLPSVFDKTPGQTVVQTWHGVGTKRIGLDIDTVQFANRSYKDTIAAESGQWDRLISPSPFCTPILRRAFAYDGEILETGVPRNDVFRAPDLAERAAAVRDRLGVDRDRRLVLYAPTWRDNLHVGGKYRLELGTDLSELARGLGDDHVLVFRGHANIADRLDPSGGVVDATDYPDAQDLLTVADVLVTDYSTTMCDFANTGRPMVFFAYDLGTYQHLLRDFYFDYRATVPGPIVEDAADLRAAVADADRERDRHADRYDAFVRRFCPLDDGAATARVVDAIFGG